ncbi:nuclease SbcCD subunit D [bacterium BMS3Abin05]|nr:nuclease SbcCD subunit D [bacterium BMS3Abin05]
MRLLHTADWHLGKHLDKFSRIEEQRAVLNEICEIADHEHVDALIISGDLFDTYNPPTDAVDLFYQTLKKLSNQGKRAVIAIAGNHDSPDRIEAPDPLARECGIIFSGYPNTMVPRFALETGLAVTRSAEGFIELKLPQIDELLRIILTPYANEYRLRTYLGHDHADEELRTLLSGKWEELAEKHCDDKGVNILAAHLFMMQEGGERPEEPEDEKPILHVGGAQEIYSKNVPEQIQYVALGHLHRKQSVDEDAHPVVYSGSPLAFSFSEANQDKYVMIIEAEPGKTATHRAVKLEKGRKLLRKRFDVVAEAVEWLRTHPDTFVELTVVTETYLTSQERKQLYDAHDGIAAIIPEIKNMSLLDDNNSKSIDLTKKIEDLFIDYFEHKHGQKPNQRLLNLFKEVLSEEEE